MKKIRLLLTLVCIAAFVIASGCSAQKSNIGQTNEETVIITTDFPRYSTIEDLTKKADLVISGTILSSTVKELNDLITTNSQDEKLNPNSNPPSSSNIYNVYTVYTIKVNDSYKGNVQPGDTIEVKVRGGEINDKNYIYEDGAKFIKNKKYLMFLASFPNSPAMLLNPIQASYTDSEDEKGNFKSVNIKNDLKLPSKYLEQIRKGKK